MSVTSTITSQSVPGNAYYSDSSDLQWSPDQSNQISPPDQMQQWQNMQQQFDASPSLIGPTDNNYNYQPSTEHATYINNQNHFTGPNYDLVDLTNQKVSNNLGYCNTPNGINTNPAIMTTGYSNNMVSSRAAPVYTSAANTWSNTTTGAQRTVTIPNWMTSKVSRGVTKKPKRIRTAFTSHQMMELELEYSRTRYLDRNRRLELSDTLQLNERTIKIWFQNRRMKDKKDRAENNEDSEATSTTESSPELGVAPLCENFQHNMSYNELSRLNSYMDHHITLMPVLGNNGVPVPVQSIVTNSHPGNYLQHGMVPNNVQISYSNRLQFQDYAIKENVEASETSDENGVLNEYLIKNESSERTLSVEDGVKIGVTGENWDLSWIRSMNMNDDA